MLLVSQLLNHPVYYDKPIIYLFNCRTCRTFSPKNLDRKDENLRQSNFGQSLINSSNSVQKGAIMYRAFICMGVLLTSVVFYLSKWTVVFILCPRVLKQPSHCDNLTDATILRLAKLFWR